MRTLHFPWLLTLSIILTDSVFGLCVDPQQSLLLELKKDLNFDRFRSTKLATWNRTTDCCSWEGIVCNDQGHVTKLNLSNEGISGELYNSTASLFRLDNLMSLDLSLNNYDCSIKNVSVVVHNLTKLEELFLEGVNMSSNGDEWGRALSSSLPNLRVLSLSGCSLSGPVDDSLLKLRSLSVIRLHDNNLSGTFPDGIFQVPKLQIIDISDNELLQGNLPEFPLNSSLQYVDLSNTKFSGTLPMSIGNLWNLSTLFLSNCQFNGTLPGSMKKLSNLFSVDFSSNNFTGFVPSFSLSKNLFWLGLSNNNFSGDISSTRWKGLTSLEQIYMSNNLLSGNIPPSLFALPLLQTIQLSNNRFNGSFPEFEIASSSTLNLLDLSHNQLENSLPFSIFQLRNLTFFDVSYNKLNGTVQLSLFQRLSELDHLDLSYNTLTVNTKGSDYSLPRIKEFGLSSCNLQTFPDLKNQTRLQILDLSNNQISGQIPKWIWEVGDMGLALLNLSYNLLVGFEEPYLLPTSLNALDLSHNKLQGKIPTLLQDIDYVDLSSNQFTSIPVDIFEGFHFLGFFSLSKNGLSGFIPESICNTTTLGVLDLSHNNLSGEIPKCIFKIGASLKVLDLRSNNFTGQIPDAFPVSCGLNALDLNGNNLNGEIPKSLTNCSSLNVLDLGHNGISGNFPCWLKNILTLQVLILRSNRLDGGLECPNNLNGIWPALQIFDVARNELTGELSGQWATEFRGILTTDPNLELETLGLSYGYYISYSKSGTARAKGYRYTVTVTSKGRDIEIPKILTIFTYIDLSSNRFHGEIPEEIGQLEALYILDMSNNSLAGQIPSSIGNLMNLESLDLSRNRLNGTIPSSLGGLSFLQYLNLSYNQLVGTIPKGSQIQTFSEDSFIGNEGLCGVPLKRQCTEEPGNARREGNGNPGRGVDWNVLSVEMGFVVGFGVVVAPILVSRRWRRWHYERVDDIVVGVFPASAARWWLRWST